jgi:N-acetylglucosamine-6-phosphate deacetylase
MCKADDHTILTCDVSGFAGCPPGEYQEGDVAVEVLPDGRLVVAGQRQFLAGSGSTTGECVVKMMDACNISLATAVHMATRNPEQLFGEPMISLEAGSEATLTVFHVAKQPSGSPSEAATAGVFQPVQTFIKGTCYSTANSPGA